MNTWTQRLQTTGKAVSMYSATGASFQEWALARLDRKGSTAHKMIGQLVTSINNNQISVTQAETRYISALEK